MIRDAFVIDPGWAVVLRDLGVSTTDVLRRAGEPDDLLSRSSCVLPSGRFFALWRALEAEAADPLLALHLGEAMTTESFQAPLFAALCSDNFGNAAVRLGEYEGLIGPLVLRVHHGPDALDVTVDCLHEGPALVPINLLLWKLVFVIRIARMGTREPVTALRVTLPDLPKATAYAAFFGVPIEVGPHATLRCSAHDASRPFLSRNADLWKVFEPSLRRRLGELSADASMHERVRAVLLELLPSGRSSLSDVSRRLAIARRTLQRRLSAEGVVFQNILDGVRTELAHHYLRAPRMSFAEISFLLGFENPNSFFRAFRGWTGTTPEAVRHALLASPVGVGRSG